MPIDSPSTEMPESENHEFFSFKNDSLLLPEHTQTNPAEDFLAYGTSDDDLQF